MANEEKRYPSRLNKKNRSNPVMDKNRSNSVLNMMIGLVFTLILITGAFIFLDKEEGSIEQPESVKIASEAELEEGSTANEPEGEPAGSGTEADSEEEVEKETEETPADKEAEPEETKEGKVTGGTITKEDSNDPVVEETIINTSWEPVGTKQKGEHVSVYEKGSADWNEKIKAISYATGLAADDMYIMMIKNGGGPQKSIGVVQSKDQSKKYRVHMEWVDGKGWSPVKLDVLKTLKGAY
ncbi:cytoskeletal protein RodZ [Planomicrobium koreense]|uniref:Cytoskeletal protein RodZ n=1 Tax=Planococcus koreensis TaxID=112331 RepID=A0A7W8FT80_9BACL|nr:YrrS family protein [Planococcus koreensis]MBB5180788.1 cytoskeletal protein RodZ [Planococcus koreensis]